MYTLDIRDRDKISPIEVDIARTIKSAKLLSIDGVLYEQVKYGVFKMVAKPDKRAGTASKADGP